MVAIKVRRELQTDSRRNRSTNTPQKRLKMNFQWWRMIQEISHKMLAEAGISESQCETFIVSMARRFLATSQSRPDFFELKAA